LVSPAARGKTPIIKSEKKQRSEEVGSKRFVKHY
jgi:hypothetical protein